ncbi:MFS transporter [Nocardia cyriacigeorgica]|uniref:MFS transporter n=1 Tax=Nocardia cyriacigeorgica TaxID=135487 RepID=UPI001895CD96|nr:MFS transporter [Nocardia cyriacigeorgica]MBF6101741.1 MFS transporter [Nocardia cyriacigeorgica]MBF6513597.1 MFS transporter [Nocardia cyriacigeorgica]
MTIVGAPTSRDVRTISRALARDRALLTGYFVGLGVVTAAWGTRIPAVQAAAGLDTAGLAAVLLAAAAGMVAGLRVGGQIAERHGLPVLLTGGGLGFAVSLALLGTCRTALAAGVAALIFGAAHGVLDVAANAAAVDCQRAYRRPIMSGLHAAYSLGALAGASIAAVTAQWPHTYLFVGIAGISIVATMAAAPITRELGAPAPEDVATPEVPQSRSFRVWLLGALAAACLLGEGAAADWSAVHLTDLDASPTLAAAAFAGYSAAMAAGRLVGDRLTTHFGASKVVRVGAMLAAAGLLAGVLSAEIVVALAGWALFGLGLSVIVPSLFSAAGSGGPRSVATVAVIGYVGLLAGPAAIGVLATATSLPLALLLPAALAAAVAFLSPRALENT